MPTHARDSILDAMSERFQTIGNGDGKWALSDTAVVKRFSQAALRNPYFPLIIYSVVGETKSVIATTGQTGIVSSQMDVSVQFWKQSYDFDQDCSDMVHDLELSIGEERTLGGTCLQAWPRTNRPLFFEDETSGVIGVEVVFEVQYRHEENSPSTKR